MTPPKRANPTAKAVIEPVGPRPAVPREHVVTLRIDLSSSDVGTQETKYSDKRYAVDAARKSLATFRPANGENQRLVMNEVSVMRKGRAAGPPTSVVVGVEGSVVLRGCPDDDAVEVLRTALHGDGYHVAVRVKRECTESGCSTAATVDWTQRGDIPAGWYSGTVCGRHNYRTCSRCGSVYLLTSTNAAGQAPSVHCETCGLVIVEWGGSKVWNAELLRRRDG
jgi:hypothetical protein